MPREIRTLDLMLTPDEAVEVEIQRREGLAYVSIDRGVEPLTEAGVLYVNVNGITVCRIYGNYDNMSFKG